MMTTMMMMMKCLCACYSCSSASTIWEFVPALQFTVIRKNVNLLVQQADETLQMWKKQIELQVREFC